MARRLNQPLVLALDVGTSSVRAIVHDARGRPVPGADAHQAYAPQVDAEGRAEVPADRLRRLTQRVVERALAGLTTPIAAVGISTFWHGLLGLDGDRPATPVLLWSDSRSWPQAVKLRGRLDANAVHQRTGCPIHPSYWPSKLAWARRQGLEPQRWCSFADHLLLSWTGELLTTVSMASGTGVHRLRGEGWDEELLADLDVPTDRLPPIGAQTLRLTRGLARRWPALAEAVIVPAAGDGALANLGSGCTTPERRALTVGTSGALRAMTTQAPPKLPDGLWCYRLDARRILVGGSFSNGGNFHAWAQATLRLDARSLERELDRMRPGEHRLAFLPLLSGERSPGFAPHAQGAVAGLTLATTPADLLRAGLEGIALDFAAVDAMLDRVVPGGRLLVGSGAGLLRSPALTRILADAIGKPLLAARNEEASARGAALLALEHLGRPAPEAAPAGRIIDPDPKAHAIYARLHERHAAFYAAVVEQSLQAAGRKGSNGG